MSRPDNWYAMSRTEQIAWEKQERARQDAEYDAEESRRRSERLESQLREKQKYLRIVKDDLQSRLHDTSEELVESEAIVRHHRDFIEQVLDDLIKLRTELADLLTEKTADALTTIIDATTVEVSQWK